jgi:hypothetical protein
MHSIVSTVVHYWSRDKVTRSLTCKQVYGEMFDHEVLSRRYSPSKKNRQIDRQNEGKHFVAFFQFHEKL